jgi:inosine/xanthosine triphosphatase
MALRVMVASANPVKVEAARRGFAAWFPGEELHVSGQEVASGISAQPMDADETLQGALNRTAEARRQAPGADYWVGIEGGVEPQATGLVAFAWVVVRSAEQEGAARSAAFPLPQRITRLVEQGVELGEADDQVFGRENSKQANGAVGILSRDLVTRTDLYAHAVLLALIPFGNPQLYPPT